MCTESPQIFKQGLANPESKGKFSVFRIVEGTYTHLCPLQMLVNVERSYCEGRELPMTLSADSSLRIITFHYFSQETILKKSEKTNFKTSLSMRPLGVVAVDF